jgi:acyl-CoA thioesterase
MTKTVHVIFARGGKVASETELLAQTIASGRSFGTELATFVQDGRPFAQSMLLTYAPAADTLRHRLVRPGVAPPAASDEIDEHNGFERFVIGGFDYERVDDLGPPRLDVWQRFPGEVDDPAHHQALIAMATLPMSIGTALRPYPGISAGQAHTNFSTAPLGHMVTFHAETAASDWLLYRFQAPHAGEGTCYGRGDVFDGDGRLVASFSQDGMLREFDRAPGQGSL